MLSIYIVWGSTYLAIRFAVQTMPPFLMAAVRFLIAGVVLFVFRRAQGDVAPSTREWRSAAVIGLLLLLGGNGGVVWAEQHVNSGHAALIVGATPLWMVLIDTLRPGGRRPGWLSAAGVLVGFAGIILLISPGASSADQIDPLSAAALIVATLCWASGSLYSRKAALPTSPLLGTGMEMLIGGLGLMAVGTLTGEWARLNLGAISRESWLGLAYLIVLGSWVGFGSYTWLLRVAPTSLVSTYAYVNPIVAVLMGNWLAHEPLTPRTLIAAAVIVSSVALTTLAHQSVNRQVSIVSDEA
jgi:drug/metabolite transporter (DMT)-like permease